MQDTSIVVDQPMPEGQKTDTIIPPQDELENQQEVVTPETEDFERTVIARDPRSIFTETISLCVNHLPEADLNTILKRHECLTTGPSATKRRRLTTMMLKTMDSRPSILDPDEPRTSHTPSHPIMEIALIDIKNDLKNLSDEIIGLKSKISLGDSKPSSDQPAIKDKIVKEVTKQLKDLWNQNLTATSRIKTRINEHFQEIDVAQVKAEELEKSIYKLKTDLKNYYNSAFFREDSKLIKEIHSKIVKGKCSATASESPINNPESSSSRTRASEEEFPSIPGSRSHSNRRDSQHESRRGTGYSITQRVERLPLPQIHVTRRNTNTPIETGVQTSQDSRNSEPNSQGSSSTPVPAKKYVFKTILITDSIIRHINDLGEGDALGNNHILDCISKSDTSGLNHLDLKRKVRGIQPAYIYIHLGVNDMLNGSTVEAALKNLKEFISYRDEYVTHAKIILSLPLPTLKSGHRYEQINLKIIELRNRMKDFVNKDTSSSKQPKDRKILMNTNSNLGRDGKLKEELCSRDGIHLTTKGQSIMLSNFRHHVHEITRSVLNKPPRARSSATYQSR